MGRLIHRLTNPLVVVLLRSPLHSLFGKSLALLTLCGRTTGRSHTFPVQYVRSGQTIYIVPGGYEHKVWWRNLINPSPVRVRAAGVDLNGIGQVFLGQVNPQIVTEAMRIYLPHFPTAARLRGLTIIDGQIAEDSEQIRKGVARDAIVKIELQPDTRNT